MPLTALLGLSGARVQVVQKNHSMKGAGVAGRRVRAQRGEDGLQATQGGADSRASMVMQLACAMLASLSVAYGRVASSTHSASPVMKSYPPIR